MGFQVKKNKNQPTVLSLTGSADISAVSDIRNEILVLMNETHNLTVDMDMVDRVDVSFVQLLCSANISFEKKEKRIDVLTGKNVELWRAVLSDAGFDLHDGCPEKKCKNCLWKGKS